MHERQRAKKWIDDYLKAHPEAYTYRLPDQPFGLGTYKPFDWFILDNGVAIAIEFKVHRLKRDFIVDQDVSRHQIYELKRFVKAGGKALVVYYDERFGSFVVRHIYDE